MSACTFRRVALRGCFGISVMVLLAGWASVVLACRMESSSSHSSRVFHKHVVGSCHREEREALAIPAKEILEALRAGKSLDLLGVVVTGDLFLDQLPLEPMELEMFSSQRVQDMLKQRNIRNIRKISGSLTIHDSWFQGIVATNLTSGTLVIVGDVDVAGTRFQKSVDFSRTTFLNTVDFSDVMIRVEGFFIGAYFDRVAIFNHVAFGTHTRFHKAFFGDHVTFLRARFNGLAEFLEVLVEQDANFSQTYFEMGTGFSGTRFRGGLDFSESVFEREAYFRFTAFEQDVSFHGTTFREGADFTNAKFQGSADFTRARFEKPPSFSGTNIEIQKQPLKALQDQRVQVGMFLTLLVLVVFFIWRIRGNKQEF